MDDRSAGLAIFVCATALFAYYTVWVLVTPFVEPGHVVLSWFPKYNLNELPWNIAAWPTEPILKPTRALVPPVAGVDVSPLIWVGILTFLSEILVGPQGILSIIERKG